MIHSRIQAAIDIIDHLDSFVKTELLNISPSHQNTVLKQELLPVFKVINAVISSSTPPQSIIDKTYDELSLPVDTSIVYTILAEHFLIKGSLDLAKEMFSCAKMDDITISKKLDEFQKVSEMTKACAEKDYHTLFQKCPSENLKVQVLTRQSTALGIEDIITIMHENSKYLESYAKDHDLEVLDILARKFLGEEVPVSNPINDILPLILQYHNLPSISKLNQILETGSIALNSISEQVGIQSVFDGLLNEIDVKNTPHNVVVCPVTKNLCSAHGEGAIRLECGHVASESAISELQHDSRKPGEIKCFYCSAISKVDHLIKLHL